jgi:hypothetical protein
MSDIGRLDVYVASVPHPGLIRSRIETALTGRPSGPGPEQAIGRAVAAAVAAASRDATPKGMKGAPN